jgi:hypothetical protein
MGVGMRVGKLGEGERRLGRERVLCGLGANGLRGWYVIPRGHVCHGWFGSEVRLETDWEAWGDYNGA